MKSDQRISGDRRFACPNAVHCTTALHNNNSINLFIYSFIMRMFINNVFAFLRRCTPASEELSGWRRGSVWQPHRRAISTPCSQSRHTSTKSFTAQVVKDSSPCIPTELHYALSPQPFHSIKHSCSSAGVKMSGHMLLVVVVVTLVLLLTVTEGVVVGHRPPTNDLASGKFPCEGPMLTPANPC